MSRIGNRPIEIPENVTVELTDGHIVVKGPKGELSEDIDATIAVEEKDGALYVSPKDNSKHARAMHGTQRSIIANMVEGTSKGFEKKLELAGVGYRAQKQGNKLVLNVGLSHQVEFEPAEGLEIEVPSNTEITVKGIDKDAVGELAANIRAIRVPEPYKGKGIHYVGEYILRKEGKTGK